MAEQKYTIFLPEKVTTAEMSTVALLGSLYHGQFVFNTDTNILYVADRDAGATDAVLMPVSNYAAGLTGEVQFNDNGELGTDSGLFWDDINKRLGIGTSSPEAEFSTSSSSASANRGVLIDQISNNLNAVLFAFRKARGSLTAPTSVASGDYISTLQFRAHDGTNFIRTAGITSRVVGSVSSGNVPTDLYFGVGNSDGDFLNSNLVLKSSGNIGINTDSPLAKLHINGGVGSLATGIAFGDGDTGIYESADDQLSIDIGSSEIVRMVGGSTIHTEFKGGIVKNISSKTADYTITRSDYTILLDGSSNEVTATLPSAVGIDGQIYNIKCVDSTNACFLAGNVAETIDGTNSWTVGYNNNIKVQAFNSNWIIL